MLSDSGGQPVTLSRGQLSRVEAVARMLACDWEVQQQQRQHEGSARRAASTSISSSNSNCRGTAAEGRRATPTLPAPHRDLTGEEEASEGATRCFLGVELHNDVRDAIAVCLSAHLELNDMIPKPLAQHAEWVDIGERRSDSREGQFRSSGGSSSTDTDIKPSRGSLHTTSSAASRSKAHSEDCRKASAELVMRPLRPGGGVTRGTSGSAISSTSPRSYLLQRSPRSTANSFTIEASHGGDIPARERVDTARRHLSARSRAAVEEATTAAESDLSDSDEQNREFFSSMTGAERASALEQVLQLADRLVMQLSYFEVTVHFWERPQQVFDIDSWLRCLDPAHRELPATHAIARRCLAGRFSRPRLERAAQWLQEIAFDHSETITWGPLFRARCHEVELLATAVIDELVFFFTIILGRRIFKTDCFLALVNIAKIPGLRVPDSVRVDVSRLLKILTRPQCEILQTFLQSLAPLAREEEHCFSPATQSTGKVAAGATQTRVTPSSSARVLGPQESALSAAEKAEEALIELISRSFGVTCSDVTRVARLIECVFPEMRREQQTEVARLLFHSFLAAPSLSSAAAQRLQAAHVAFSGRLAALATHIAVLSEGPRCAAGADTLSSPPITNPFPCKRTMLYRSARAMASFMNRRMLRALINELIQHQLRASTEAGDGDGDGGGDSRTIREPHAAAARLPFIETAHTLVRAAFPEAFHLFVRQVRYLLLQGVSSGEDLAALIDALQRQDPCTREESAKAISQLWLDAVPPVEHDAIVRSLLHMEERLVPTHNAMRTGFALMPLSSITQAQLVRRVQLIPPQMVRFKQDPDARQPPPVGFHVQIKKECAHEVAWMLTCCAPVTTPDGHPVPRFNVAMTLRSLADVASQRRAANARIGGVMQALVPTPLPGTRVQKMVSAAAITAAAPGQKSPSLELWLFQRSPLETVTAGGDGSGEGEGAVGSKDASSRGAELSDANVVDEISRVQGLTALTRSATATKTAVVDGVSSAHERAAKHHAEQLRLLAEVRLEAARSASLIGFGDVSRAAFTTALLQWEFEALPRDGNARVAENLLQEIVRASAACQADEHLRVTLLEYINQHRHPLSEGRLNGQLPLRPLLRADNGCEFGVDYSVFAHVLLRIAAA